MFANQEIKKEGLTFLEKMVKNKEVHNSMLYLIKNSVKDKRFIKDSREYGIDLSQYAASRSEVRIESKELVVNAFTKDKRVI